MNKSEIAIFNKRLADRIRVAREVAGIKQEQVAKALGMSRPNYVNLESGRMNIYAHHVWKLATIFGVKIQTLMQ